MSFIKMVDLDRQYQAIKPEIDAAIQAVLDSTEFIQGRAVQEFETALASYLQVPHVIGCASGTDALQVALMALGIGPGDEVITTPFTFVATVETIVLLGIRPVFVDIEPRTCNIDPGGIESKISSRTRAIIPVHLFGHPADMGSILALAKDHGLKVIEDAAQAIGARYHGKFVGSLGEIGCLSFFPSKNLGAYGDGGALLCKDGTLAERIRMIVNHGSRLRYHHEILGVNSRLDSIQAAILKVKLSCLDAWSEARNRIARRYSEGLADLDLVLPCTKPGSSHVFNQFSIRTPRREALAAFLRDRGIATAVHYPKPLHQQPAYQQIAVGASFPVAEAVSREILSLPIFPEMTEEEVAFVIGAIREFFHLHLHEAK